jgi:hypothetical protein
MKFNSKFCVSQQNNTDELEMPRFTTKVEDEMKLL